MIRFFVAHPTAANLLMMLLAVLGLIALPTIRRETYPDFSLSMVQVTVVYPGASAGAVEETIVRRVEDAIDGVESVAEVVSQAREGVAQITVEMQSGGDMTQFLSDIKSKVQGIADFPTDAEEAVVAPGNFAFPVVSIAVTGPMSADDLKSYCEQLKREIARYPHISQVNVAGFSQRQLQIRLKEGVVSQYGLSIGDLADTISSSSLDVPAGAMQTREGEILVRFSGERRTVGELEDLVVVSGTRGGEVRLGDIAEIANTFEDEAQKVLFNGQRAGMLNVTKTKTQDSLEVLASVKEFIADGEAKRPKGVELTLTQDQASVINDRLDLLLTNGWQGLLLVFGTLWLFFNLRLAFWVAAGLPVSFLGALFIMGQTDFSLNMMTMLALLMALGLLMDDAIVLSENVASHLQLGKKPIEAAIAGVKEVAIGVFSSFATTLAIFIPLAFLEGTIGQVLLVIPVVLCLVLAVSLIEAFLILPNHLGHMKEKEDGRFRKRFNEVFDNIRENWVGTAVDYAVKFRYATLGITLAAFFISIGLVAGGCVKFQGMPELDGDTAELRLELPSGSILAETEESVSRGIAALEVANAKMSKLQEGDAKFVRSYAVRFNYNADVGDSGPHLATITADLLAAETRKGTLDEFMDHWREAMGPMSDVATANFTQPAGGPAGDGISLRVQGDDLDDLQAAAKDIMAWYGEFEGVSDMATDLKAGKPEIHVQLRPGAMSMNVRGSTIAGQLRAGLSGSRTRPVQMGIEEYEVQVQLAESEADTLSDLEYFQISLGQQKYVPLGSVATLEAGRGFSRVSRVDGRRTVTVTGDVNAAIANAQELTGLFTKEKKADIEKRYPGVQVDMGGSSSETDETMGSMVRGLGIGLFCIFFLLSFQFRSYVEPIIVLIAIPLALIGVIWGNMMLDDPLSLPGMLGFCALAGVVVNDAIILIEFIKTKMGEGASTSEAACQASRSRFRAVLLTSVTTMAGLIPLLFETSLQAQTLVPVATSIVFGTFTSTILILLVLPALYAILGDLGLTAQDVGRGHDEESEDAPAAVESTQDAAEAAPT